MYRNNFTRKLFKTKNKKRKTKIRKQKTKIRKQKTKIMRGGGEKEGCIDYLKTLTEYSKIKLYTFSGIIKKGLQDVYDNKPLSEKIDELIRKIDQLIGANYTLNEMKDVVYECRNVLNLLLLLLKIRQQPDKLDINIDKNIITTIIHIYEIIFGLESIIQINDNTDKDCITYFEDKMNKLINTYFDEDATHNQAEFFCFSLYKAYKEYGGTELTNNITKICIELNIPIHKKQRDYSGIKRLADWLLRDVSAIIVYIRNMDNLIGEIREGEEWEVKIGEFMREVKIGEFMSYITQIILISEILDQGIENSKLKIQGLILKIKEKTKAATRIQKYTRSSAARTNYANIKSARAATMSRAATRLQALMRGKSARNKPELEEIRVAMKNSKIVADELKQRTKTEEETRKELDEAKKDLDDLLEKM
jgi:hypothetical protein